MCSLPHISVHTGSKCENAACFEASVFSSTLWQQKHSVETPEILQIYKWALVTELSSLFLTLSRLLPRTALAKWYLEPLIIFVCVFFNPEDLHKPLPICHLICPCRCSCIVYLILLFRYLLHRQTLLCLENSILVRQNQSVSCAKLI